MTESNAALLVIGSGLKLYREYLVRSIHRRARAAGLDYFFLNTAKPLDEGLRNFLALRQRRM